MAVAREVSVDGLVNARDLGGLPRPSWLTTLHVDHDGLENLSFWADYWKDGRVGTALYYASHLAVMPERTLAALDAIATAPPGAVLFHCAAGRDRTGLLAAILLAAAGVEEQAIVADYALARRHALSHGGVELSLPSFHQSGRAETDMVDNGFGWGMGRTNRLDCFQDALSTMSFNSAKVFIR